jgi:hypothetical protein
LLVLERLVVRPRFREPTVRVTQPAFNILK